MGAGLFALQAVYATSHASTIAAPVIDSDDGSDRFDRHPCGNELCMVVQLNGVTEESDLPEAVGRFLIKLGKSLRGETGRSGADTLLIHFNAYRILPDGTRQPVPWAMASVSIAEVASARPADFERALRLVRAIRFDFPDAVRATKAFCGDPANVGPSDRFCRLVQ